MTSLNTILRYLQLSWWWFMRGLSADFSTHESVYMSQPKRLVRTRYAPLATYVLEPAHTWSYTVQEVPAVPKKPVQPKATGHVPGTTEQFRQTIVCKKCGSAIDDNALVEPCPVCHTEGVTVGECTCLHFPEKEWIAHNRVRHTLEEMTARNPSCPIHGRNLRPAN